MNQNRNPLGSETFRRMNIERSLEGLGVRRIIWLRGDPSEPITSGHIDSYALFTARAEPLVETIDDDDLGLTGRREHDIATLESSVDAARRRLQIGRLDRPRRKFWKFKGATFAPSYLNAYVANGAVLTARFGDIERDEAAQEFLQRGFPGSEVMMLQLDHIAAGGGGIHCLTQPMFAERGL